MSSWARPCDFWKAGDCTRGISCRFRHDGIPVEEGRCFICRSHAHTSRGCDRPGGLLDSQKEKHWGAYRVRKAAAFTTGKLGKDAKRVRKGGGK